MFIVIWDNGHATGGLPGRYETEAEAEAAGNDWAETMIAADPDPVAAREEYWFDVIEEEAPSYRGPDPDGRDFDNLGDSPDY